MIPLGALVEVFLEETSNRNLVAWYAEEIAEGTMKNISHGGRRQLRKQGIVEETGQRKLCLTAYGKRLLEETENE